MRNLQHTIKHRRWANAGVNTGLKFAKMGANTGWDFVSANPLETDYMKKGQVWC